MPDAEHYLSVHSERTYRVYRFSPQGRIASAEIISAADDDQAKVMVQALPVGHGIELWERARCLARYPMHEVDA